MNFPTDIDLVAILTMASGWVTSIGAGIWAFIQQRKAGRKEVSDARIDSLKDVIEADKLLIATIASERDSWRDRHDQGKVDTEKYRQYVHDKEQVTQAQLLDLTKQNSDLRVKTDLTPILDFHKKDAEHKEKVSQIMETTANVLNMIVEKLNK